jgi:transposase-like protein
VYDLVMKNTYAKKSHFSVRKFRRFLQLFCKDLTAKQIAELLQVNRKTINLWLMRIRARIRIIVEEERFINADNLQMDEMFFTRTDKRFPKWQIPYEEVCVFGMVDGNSKAYATIVDKADHESIMPVILLSCKEGATIFTDASVLYKGLSKMGYNHKFVNHSQMEFCRIENGIKITTNRIEGLWGCIRIRFTKFRGIKWEYLPLHIAESVWRYNHRHDDIYKILLKEFRTDKMGL